MGLVSDPCPIDRLCWVNAAEGMFKTVQARQLCRRPADQLLELRAQMVLADAHLVTQRPDRQRTMALGDLRESILYGIEPIRVFTETGKQVLFQQSKPRL